jgi:hypothetical protein
MRFVVSEPKTALRYSLDTRIWDEFSNECFASSASLHKKFVALSASQTQVS